MGGNNSIWTIAKALGVAVVIVIIVGNIQQPFGEWLPGMILFPPEWAHYNVSDLVNNILVPASPWILMVAFVILLWWYYE